MGGLRVDEGDLETEEPGPRGLVDQLRSTVREISERGGKIPHLVGDVVHARAPLGEELPNRRVGAERLHQLDPTLAEPQRRSLDALVLHSGSVLDAGAEQPLVRVYGLVEVVDRHPDVMNP